MTAAPRTLGTLLRHLAELLDADVEAAYRAAGLDYRPRYTPVVRLLTTEGPSSIRAVARFAGITHSAASQTVADMVRRGLASTEPGADGRERIVRLTAAGEALLPALCAQWAATNAAAAALEAEIALPLHAALARAIAAVEARPFGVRIATEADRSGARAVLSGERTPTMPTDQPTSAPEEIGTDAREADTAAGVMHDDALDRLAGGGGMTAADPLADGGSDATGTTPNSPIDTGVAPPDTDGAAATESRREASQAAPAEPHPKSQ